MRINFRTALAVAVATAGMTWGATAHAQYGPSQVFQNDPYYLTAAGEPAAAAPAAGHYADPACGVEAACGCEESIPSCGCCPDGYEFTCGDPWTLQQRCNPWGITYGGWINGGITGNDTGVRTNDGNSPVAFNDKSNGGQLNQLWFFAERATDTGGCGWDWGFRVDYLFGTDGPDTQAFGDNGWDTTWNSSAEYGSAMPQLYGTVAYNDLTVKIGHFYTIIGYEVVPAPDNFFYSHSYTMLYAEPFTHTGVLAEYAWNDRVTFYGGWVAGWDSGFTNGNGASMFLGGVSLGLSDNVTFTYATTVGDWGDGIALNAGGTATEGNLYMQSLLFDVSLSDRLTYIFQSDLGVNSGLVGDDTHWYGINQYLLYDINCCWGAGVRFEWFRDDDGVRIPTAQGEGSYWALTAGLNWKPHANFTVRPEVRYDWFSGEGRPYANNTQVDQLTYGVDAIFTF